MGIAVILAHRVAAAASTVPDPRGWLRTAVLLLLIGWIALPVGFRLGFLKVDPIRSRRIGSSLLAMTLFCPALVEEVLYRVLLLPRAEENASPGAQWLWGAISLILFVANHPLISLVASQARQRVYRNPVFLSLAAILGLACTAAYLTTGSLWPPVTIHWVAVAAWLLLLGGYGRLHDG